VEAPHVEQGALSGRLLALGVEVGDAAHDEPARDLVRALLRGERGERDFGDLGPGDPRAGGLVEDGVGVLDRCPRALFDAADGGLDRGSQAYGHGHVGAAGYDGPHGGPAEERRVHPDQDRLMLAEQAAGGLDRVRDQPLGAAG
jgi:hypothetical protein